MNEMVLVSVASGVVGAAGATVVWGSAWLYRIEQVSRETEQAVFDSAGQQLTKVIGRSAVPVYDLWERDVLNGPTMELPVTVARPMVVAAVEVPPCPVPSLLGTLLLLVQYAGEQGLRWVRSYAVARPLAARRAWEHPGWDTPEGLAELQRVAGTRGGRHRAKQPTSAGVAR
ncbi:hypothetical protein [Micromonospora sp. RV43]|uniref:hypothetical protein n=1 Tax=Micromonospora sp. RV43 TaxID=1661387 RepID=UPI00064BD99F|nr:hypothetical protein [Micromonospora sp. RV43]